jgi:hypothetical protein
VTAKAEAVGSIEANACRDIDFEVQECFIGKQTQ